MDRQKEIYLFHQGTYYHAYNFLGCHIVENNEIISKNVENSNNLNKNNNNNKIKCENVEKFNNLCDKKCENVENDEKLNNFYNTNEKLSNITTNNDKNDNEKIYGAYFRCWAPNAKKISVVGDFNNWDYTKNKMQKIDGSGIWEVFVESVKIFDNYKFQILTADNRVLMKADPFAFHSETNGATASKVYKFEDFNWTDKCYFENKLIQNHYEMPMNVYEVNLSSWKRKTNGDYYSYREIADELSDYAQGMGYTHIEVMPITEYPYDGSWGYQTTGYFSVTSRFGTPQDFRYFVNKFHEKGIGVILDWSPAHFPKDEHGLIEWDGTYLFENQGWDKIEHKSWGTRRFDYGRSEVQSFLISSATFFIEKFHIDGIRVDAVASMLYLDYDKKQGEWIPNSNGDNKNLEAIAFLQKLNSVVLTKYPSVIMIAEESTAFPLVTKPSYVGGLGFNYKWNIGWMNDTLSYVSIDPFFRKDNHEKLTFSMFYAFSENFILPISHDEVVHGKKSLLNKMFGSYEEKFEMLKTFMMYMFAHPGKKLQFMGNEFAQFDEWNNSKGIDFMLLEFEKHYNIFKFTKELNFAYLNYSELYEIDYSWDGFKWLTPNDKRNNVVAFERKNKNGEIIVCVCNFSPVGFEHYRVGVEEGRYICLLATNEQRFGGTGKVTKFVTSERVNVNGFEYSIDISLEPYSAIYFKKQELKLSIVSKFLKDENNNNFESVFDNVDNKLGNVCINKKNNNLKNFKNDKNIINKLLKYKIRLKIDKIVKNEQDFGEKLLKFYLNCKNKINNDKNLQNNIISNNKQDINKDNQDKNENIKNAQDTICLNSDDLFLSMLRCDLRQGFLREKLGNDGDLEFNEAEFYESIISDEKLCETIVARFGEEKIGKPRKRGRPRKVVAIEILNKPKRSRGRPRKMINDN
ncbi:MAG: 1,4-alpha-glucan branching protein GlgB [Clostridia bacterium]|nr:1,4-alpha-glucan branching protein GlgB [Clostridia bacterium]